jgi:DNA-binding CsgD family transcriptional regulator
MVKAIVLYDTGRVEPFTVPVAVIPRSEFANGLPGIDVAGTAPSGELHGVDSAVADLGAMHHRVVHSELLGQLALREASSVPHSPEHAAHLSIGGFVLRTCCHYSSSLKWRSVAARLAASQLGVAMVRQNNNPATTGLNDRPPLPLGEAEWTVVVRTLRLSPQQARIVESLLQGNRDKQIARDVGVSVPTERTYLSRIFLRVGVQDRIELILKVFATAHALGNNGECHRD